MAISGALDFTNQLQQIVGFPVKLLPIREFVSDNELVENAKCDEINKDKGLDSKKKSDDINRRPNSDYSTSCPFDCCQKKLSNKLFSDCMLSNATIKFRLGLEFGEYFKNQVPISIEQSLINSMNMNMKRPSSIIGQVPQLGAYLPKKASTSVLFEGKVPGPMRFDELIKSQGVGPSDEDGDKEILLLERNNQQATGVKAMPGIQSQILLTRGDLYSPSAALGHSNAGSYGGQMQFYSPTMGINEFDYGIPTSTITSAVSSSDRNLRRSPAEISQPPPWVQQLNKELSITHSFKDKAPKVWCQGQMEVTPTDNVRRISKSDTDCKIPVIEMKPYSASPPQQTQQQNNVHQRSETLEFIDQQLNNHLKSFKYIKPAQQQIPTLQTQISQEQIYNYNNNQPNYPQATIGKKMPQNRGQHELQLYQMEHGARMPIYSLSPKSNPTPQQQLQQLPISPRAALEQLSHYEKLRKYWDYQHQLLGPFSGDEYNQQYNPYINYSEQQQQRPGKSQTPTIPFHHQAASPFLQHSYNVNANTGNGNWQFPSPGPSDTSYNSGRENAQQHMYGIDFHQQNPNIGNKSSTFPTRAQTKMYPPSAYTSTCSTKTTLNGQLYPELRSQMIENRAQQMQWNWSGQRNRISQRKPETQTGTIYRPTSSQAMMMNLPVKRLEDAVATITAVGKENTSQPGSSILKPITPSILVNNISELGQNLRDTDNKEGDKIKGKSPTPEKSSSVPVIIDISELESVPKKGEGEESPKDKPTDLSLSTKRKEQCSASPDLNPKRSKSEGSVNDTASYDHRMMDHIVLLDKRVGRYMCRRCLECLKSDQEIRNHLFCKMLQNSIQCHVCREIFKSSEYPEHLKGHGVRAMSN